MPYNPIGADDDGNLPPVVRAKLEQTYAPIGAVGSGGEATSTVVPDMANSWWQKSDAVYDPVTRRVFIGGCSRGGEIAVGMVDLALGSATKIRLNDERFLADDHLGVALAFDFSLNRRPIAVYSTHDRPGPSGEHELHVREADAYQSFDSLGPETLLRFGGGSVAYGSAIAKPTSANVRINVASGSAVLNAVTIASAPTSHGFVDGMRVWFTASGGAPAPFVAGTSYYVVNSTADPNQFGLAATVGGAAIVATSTVSDASKLVTDTGRGLVHCRVAGTATWVARSTNFQVSVTERPTSTPPRFDDTTEERYRLVNTAYIGFTRAGNTFWCIATSDPTPSGDPSAPVSTYFFKGTVSDSGAIRNSAGNVLGHLWGPAPAVGQPLIALTGGTSADLVYTASGNDGVRYYDVARGGDMIAVCRFDRRDYDVDAAGAPNQAGRNPENGGTVSVLRRKTSATTNSWIFEDVVLTGKPFGAYKSVYIGGACFERENIADNALIAVVESGGVWSVRRYVRTGAAYPATTPGTWALDKVVYTAPAGYKLGRPRIPVNSEGLATGQRVCVISEYSYYSILNFTDWHSRQRVVTY